MTRIINVQALQAIREPKVKGSVASADKQAMEAIHHAKPSLLSIFRDAIVMVDSIGGVDQTYRCLAYAIVSVTRDPKGTLDKGLAKLAADDVAGAQSFRDKLAAQDLLTRNRFQKGFAYHRKFAAIVLGLATEEKAKESRPERLGKMLDS